MQHSLRLQSCASCDGTFRSPRALNQHRRAKKHWLFKHTAYIKKLVPMARPQQVVPEKIVQIGSLLKAMKMTKRAFYKLGRAFQRNTSAMDTLAAEFKRVDQKKDAH